MKERKIGFERSGACCSLLILIVIFCGGGGEPPDFPIPDPGDESGATPTNGKVLDFQKISDTEGSFNGLLDGPDGFGKSIATIDDLDGDDVPELAVGMDGDDDGGPIRGAVWILFMNTDGTVKDHQKISDTSGGFTGVLNDYDRFGGSVASPGDLDGDGVADLAVGSRYDDDGGTDRGAVWILFLNTDGTVKDHQKISATEGGFTGSLAFNSNFAGSLAFPGDLNEDGVMDLAVGAFQDSDGGSGRGAVWILFLDKDGTVKAHQKISDTQGNFIGGLDNQASFGYSVAAIGDIDTDGVPDLAVGSPNDDDGGASRGAVWILLLDNDGTVIDHRKISDTEGDFTGGLNDGDEFGNSLHSPGDLNGDGISDLIAGAWIDDDGGTDRGALWILFLDSSSEVISHQKISSTGGDFSGSLDDGDQFGVSITSPGDLNGDGVTDLACGALSDDDGGPDRGAVWIMFLQAEN